MAKRSGSSNAKWFFTGVLPIHETIPLQILDPLTELCDVGHAVSADGSKSSDSLQILANASYRASALCDVSHGGAEATAGSNSGSAMGKLRVVRSWRLAADSDPCVDVIVSGKADATLLRPKRRDRPEADISNPQRKIARMDGRCSGTSARLPRGQTRHVLTRFG